jgi:hypothetical protein
MGEPTFDISGIDGTDTEGIEAVCDVEAELPPNVCPFPEKLEVPAVACRWRALCNPLAEGSMISDTFITTINTHARLAP